MGDVQVACGRKRRATGRSKTMVRKRGIYTSSVVRTCLLGRIYNFVSCREISFPSIHHLACEISPTL